MLLIYTHLTTVHKLKQSFHLFVPDILEENNRMLIRGVVEHGLEVGGAGGQHHLVGLQVQPVTGQGDVHKGFVVQQVLEDREKVVLMVVPPQTV